MVVENGDGDGIKDEPEPISMIHDELSIFLYGIGMGHLHEKFVRNDLLFPIVFTLTETDLRKIGISADDARKLLEETTKFGAITARPVTPEPTEEETVTSSTTGSSLHEMLRVVAGISQHLLFLETSIDYLRINLEKNPECLTKYSRNTFRVITKQRNNHFKCMTALRESATEFKKALASKHGLSIPSNGPKSWSTRTLVLSTTLVGTSLLALVAFKKLYCS